MPMFDYTAKAAASGQILKGQLDVPTRDDVIAFLRKSRMTPVSVLEAPRTSSCRRSVAGSPPGTW